MAETKYSFNKECDGPRLAQEIGLSSIVTALDRIEGSTNLTDVWFKDTLSNGDQTTLSTLVTDHVNTPLPDNEVKTVKVEGPKDPANRQVVRFAATIDGWHYQLLTTEITTAKKDGFYCKDEDGNDVGFITHKIYDSNGAEITDAANEGQAVETRIWIRPTHNYEVIGAIFGQNSVPASDIRLWVTGLPGIYNVRFARGGINLKHAGANMYQLADGRASKYLAYNAQAADANSFKFTLKHPQGIQHTLQVSLEIYKAP